MVEKENNQDNQNDQQATTNENPETDVQAMNDQNDHQITVKNDHNDELQEVTTAEIIDLSPENTLEEDTLEESEETEGAFFRNNKQLVALITTLVVLLIGIALFLFYPFSFKVSGEWYSSNVSGLTLQVTGKKASVKQAPSDGVTYSYIGQLASDGVNGYILSDIKVEVEIDKSAYFSEDIEVLQKNEKNMYDILEDTEKKMIIKYKDAALKNMFDSYNRNRLVTLKLPIIYLPFQKQELVMNSQYFYQDLIKMNK